MSKSPKVAGATHKEGTLFTMKAGGTAEDPAAAPSIPHEPGLRPWQARGFKALDGHRLRALLAPTGSGKSRLIKALANAELRTNSNVRIIMTIPQWLIERSFRPEADWPVRILNGAGAIDDLLDFVIAPTDPEDRLILCTHQTLVLAHPRMSTLSGVSWDGVSLYIDEAHHSHCEEGKARKKESKRRGAGNKIGEVVADVINTETAKLTLVTATWFRAKIESIVPAEMWPNFTKFVYTPVEYLESMKHLKEVSFSFHAGDAVEALRQLGADRVKRTIVYLPHVQTRHTKLLDGKHAALETFREAYGFKGVDLVTVDGRDAVVEKLLYRIERGTAPALVWALGLGKEGFDWPELERVIVIGERASLPETMQIFGRLLRDHPGKARVEYHLVLPCTAQDADEPETLKILLNSMLTALCVEWQFERQGQRKPPTEARTLGPRTVEESDPVEIAARDEVRLLEAGEQLVTERTMLALREACPYVDETGAVDLQAVDEKIGETLRTFCALCKITDLRDWQAKFGEKKPNLTIEQIRVWMEEHKARTGKWPSQGGGRIEGQNETWKGVDQALRMCCRGLNRRHTTLASLVRSMQSKVSVGRIIIEAKAYARAHRRVLPTANSEGSCCGRSWLEINDALKRGHLGLAGGSSLSKLLKPLIGQNYISARSAAITAVHLRPEVKAKRWSADQRAKVSVAMKTHWSAKKAS